MSRLFEMNGSFDGLHIRPGNPYDPAAPKARRHATESTAVTPGGRTGKDRLDRRRVFAQASEVQVVDLPTASALGVDELMVEQAQPEIDALAHPCPMLLRIISGIAAIATSRMTTR
jgi:hypothetical protein